MKKEIVRQVGYLRRLYRDARSTEHNKHKKNIFLHKVFINP